MASETARVPVDSLRYTQESCSSWFCCGRPLEQTIDLFVNGAIPAEFPWCVLRVVRRNGLLLSMDNRRLYALREAQRQIRKSDPCRVLYARSVALFKKAALALYRNGIFIIGNGEFPLWGCPPPKNKIWPTEVWYIPFDAP